MMELIFVSIAWFIHHCRIGNKREDRWRITVDLRELIDQLRDLRFTYPVPGDGPVADKVATLLEQAIAGKGAIEHD